MKSLAIDSILNRIDDLFFMAIRSPAHDDDGADQFIITYKTIFSTIINAMKRSTTNTEDNYKYTFK